MVASLEAHLEFREGLLAVVQSQVQAAAHPSSDMDPSETVHATRVAIKHLRAILCLVRPVVGPMTEAEEDRLRQAAGLLAPQRDAMIVRQALTDLLEERLTLAQRAAVGAVLERLSRRPDWFQVPGPDPRAALNQARAALEASADQFRQAPWASADFEALAPSLRRTMKKLRDRFDSAYTRGEEEDFHRWRKTVKRAYAQFNLLRPVWPKRLGDMARTLRQLGNRLGDDHDLMVLRDLLVQRRDDLGGSAQVDLVLEVIGRKSRRLRARCRELGGPLAELKPKSFIRRLVRKYHAWRGSSPPPASLAA